jgi:hypothetical protein
MWTAKAGPYADLAIGRCVTLEVELSAAYFFDPDTGDAIPAARPSIDTGPPIDTATPGLTANTVPAAVCAVT